MLDQEFSDSVRPCVDNMWCSKALPPDWPEATCLATDALRAMLCQTILAKSAGRPNRAEVRYNLNGPKALDPREMMLALERREYTGDYFYGEDLSEVGEALTSLLGPVNEQL